MGLWHSDVMGFTHSESGPSEGRDGEDVVLIEIKALPGNSMNVRERFAYQRILCEPYILLNMFEPCMTCLHLADVAYTA